MSYLFRNTSKSAASFSNLSQQLRSFSSQRNGKDTISSKSNLDLFEYGANSRFLKSKLDHRENTCYISNE